MLDKDILKHYLAAHLIPKLLELLLADDSSVAKPASVWLNATVGQLFGLVVLLKGRGDSSLVARGGVDGRKRHGSGCMDSMNGFGVGG